jgi:streptogrisin D
MTVLKLVTSGLSATAQSLTNITPTTVSAAALQSAWLKVFDQSRPLLARAGGYSLEIDPATQEVLVTVDMSKVTQEVAKNIEAISPDLVHVAFDGGAARAVRNVADGPPHWGGSIIWPDYNPANYCSAGFSVWKNSNNADTSVTAGHCGTAGSNGGTFKSGALDRPGSLTAQPTGISYFFGTKQGTQNYPDYDQARLEGSSYTGTLRVGGGDDTQTTRQVRGATDPVIGDLVCQSGVTSEAICDIRVGKLDASYCDGSGCTTFLMSGRRADDGTTVRPGDSGGPVYLRFSGGEAGIRAMVIAGGDPVANTTNFRRLFAERYYSIAGHLDVRIMTG